MSDRGYLLGLADAMTRNWVNSWSIAAIPPLRRTRPSSRSNQQSARDTFVVVWLALAMLGVVISSRSAPVWFNRGIATVGVYRAVDLLISFFRAGVFLSFRGDIEIAHEPQWRIQRLLLATFINFFEVILWYATVYRYASLSALSDTSSALSTFASVNGSFATMTTLGTGITPTSWPLAALIAAQWFTSILMLVVVVGLLVSLLTAEQDAKVETVGESPRSGWLKPLAVTAVLLTTFYGLLWRGFSR